MLSDLVLHLLSQREAVLIQVVTAVPVEILEKFFRRGKQPGMADLQFLLG